MCGSTLRAALITAPSCQVYAPGLRRLPTNSAILDGELCLIDPRGGANFYRLMHQMRPRWPKEGLLVSLAFDLLPSCVNRWPTWSAR
jgi:ATP-dependent DNA ligase